MEQCKLKTFRVFVLERSVQEFLLVGYLVEAQGPSVPAHQNVVSQLGLQLGTLEQDSVTSLSITGRESPSANVYKGILAIDARVTF